MSTRTKGFFDQNHNKPRPAQWHRNHSKAPLNETSNNTSPPKPPIPATSQTKSKLKAFQFVPGHPRDSEEAVDKENTVENNDADMVGPPKESRLVNEEVAKDTDTPSAPREGEVRTTAPRLPHAQTFPCTPGTRLPLEDLIGNSDENAKKPEPQNESPEEYLGWIPHSSSNFITPNRKRKRARSSSPSCDTSSQRQEASASFTGTVAEGENEAMETDPVVADLWQRYGADKQTDGESKLPSFSHLMFQASPRSHETPAKSAGLRRWASTGNDWPTSKSKRRRVNGNTKTSLWQDEQVTESGEKSKFVDMLKKVEESLASQKLAKQQANPTVRIEGPSSSSPLPEVGAHDAFNAAPAASPLQARQSAVASKTAEHQTRDETSNVPNGVARQPLTESRGNTVHNDNIPAQAPDSVISAPLYLQSKAPLPAYKRPSITRTPSDSAWQRQNLQTSAPANLAITDDYDEFGDDLELSAEDLEELMSQPPPLDQRPLHQIPQHPNPPPQQEVHNVDGHDAPVQDKVNAGCAAQPIQLNDEDHESDEFGMDDIDEDSFAAAEMSATQAFRISPRKRSPRKSKPQSPSMSSHVKSTIESKGALKHLQRYVVKKIVEGEYTNAKGRHCPEKLLVAEEERTSMTTAITIRDSWLGTSISPGNVVHVAHVRQTSSAVPSSSPPGQITISDADRSPLLIVHPDHMLSATTVADSFDCIRKAVLQDRIKATGETSKSMVYGKVLHEIFQQALSANRWDDIFLADLVERTLQNHVESLWELGMKDAVLANEEIRSKMDELASWARIFVAKSPSEVAVVDDKQGEKVWMSISKLIAIEEHIWSPRYGLKGNIDATVQATVVDHPNEPGKTLIAPFEVKTGRTTQSPAHRAQTALYTLLLSDRYDVSVKAGILYYLESSAMSRIAPPMNEIRQMVQQRNRLAAYLYLARNPPESEQPQEIAPQTQDIEESGLPGLLKNPFKCSKCYAQQSCFAYHALVENGSADSAGMTDDRKKNYGLVWQEAVGHLRLSAKDPTQAALLKQWFTKWDRLLTFEEGVLSKFRKELWTMESTEREAAARCFGGLVIQQHLAPSASVLPSSAVDGVAGSGGKIHRFAYTFAHSKRKPGHSFAQGTQLTVGEPVVVSSESGQWALANGYVIATTKHDITVAVDRRLGNARERQSDFDDERNQTFSGIMTVGPDSTATPSRLELPMLYRLDKDEFSNGLALVRNNLVTLMSSHPIHTKLRSQIILNSEPTFTTTSTIRQLAPSQLGDMNEDQRAAVSKVLNAKDYALILGMPGTGKTTTIAHIIRALLADNQTILLTAFTHTAVDNILLKIRDIAPPNSILRLGVPAKVNSQVQEFCQLAATPRKSIEEVENAYMGCRIVATTCMGVNHAVFNRRAFDVCLVDEASQITLPTSLGPLLHARKFVLVGDHYQLPPLVQNKAALDGGLDVSLFRQLSEEQPGAVATLGKQYRMCDDIMSLSNALIYNGQLRCGNDEVAQRTLQIGPLSDLSAFHNPSAACSTSSRGSKCWIENLLRPQRKVIFANTDPSGNTATETLTLGKNITNQFEATLVAQLVLGLEALGIPSGDIGVITLYRSQLALIRQLFKRAGISSDIEIDSADRFQGRDKECIILSMVRSNEAGIVGDLLKDWRRVNVALTRARSKLIILGSQKTLGNNDLLAKFLSIVQERGWTSELPKDADSCHTFNFSSQAASEVLAESTLSPAKVNRNFSPANPNPTLGSRKISRGSPRGVLKDSLDAANRSPSKQPTQKNPAKVIFGQASQTKSAKAMQQAVIDIFEDLNSENL